MFYKKPLILSMKEFCPKKLCTGCALCAALCPTSSIQMVEGYLGHLFPKINQATCIDCGLCQKKCPSLSTIEKTKPNLVYAAWSKDIVDYKTSTSGGAASLLSSKMIEEGGVVYGCAMLPDIEVKHIRVDSADQLSLLKGSKYVQSNIEEVIPLLKKDVKTGRKVLFIGTPCQVAAIKNIYKEKPKNLYLVDLICHGTPSLNSLQTHIKKVAPHHHYDNVIFRDDTYIVVVVVDGREVYRKELFTQRFSDLYLNAFFDGFSYRDSCYQCKYACPDRVSDITIGDFWGLGALEPADEIPAHQYGCSAILINTTIGKMLFDSIADRCHHYQRSVEECIKGNEQLRHPKELGPRIKIYRTINRYIDFPSAYYLANADFIIKYNLRSKK